MKLNNHGWGYRDMIVWTIVILLLLLFVTIQIENFYDNMQKNTNDNNVNNVVDDEKNDDLVIVGGDKQEEDEENDEKPITSLPVDYDYYHDREEELKKAALSYLNDYKYDLGESILNISLDTLVNLGYIREIFDQVGETICDGYANAYIDDNGQYIIKPYVECVNYRTK